MKEQEWLNVSPGKASRSIDSMELKFGSVSILTKSRFEVLRPMEEGEIMEKENEEEEQLEIFSGDEVEEKEEMVIPRQSLPRDSKLNHRYLRSKKGQKDQDACLSNLSKKKPRRQ